MSASRTAQTVFRAALALGLLGDHLLRVPVWGLYLALWTGVVVGYRLMLSMRRHEEAGTAAPRHSSWVWIATLFFGAMWVVRDAPLLLAFDLLAVIALLCLTLVQAQGVASRVWASAGVFGFPSQLIVVRLEREARRDSGH